MHQTNTGESGQRWHSLRTPFAKKVERKRKSRNAEHTAHCEQAIGQFCKFERCKNHNTGETHWFQTEIQQGKQKATSQAKGKK